MKKKILIVEDSALMRRVISDIILEDDKLEVTETARDGREALEFINGGLKVDLMLLDIQMPYMNGVELLKKLNSQKKKITTLIVSSIASKSAKETIEALELGAFDFVRKPENTYGHSLNVFKVEMMKRVYLALKLGEYKPRLDLSSSKHSNTYRKPSLSAWTNKKNKEPEKIEETEETKQVRKPRVSIRSGEMLAVIASSTGGPKALQSVVPKFSAKLPCPLVIVQHMPAGFTGSLANRLNEMSKVRVKEAQDGEILENGVVYIAMGGKQCEIIQMDNGKYKISENDKAPRGGLKPCADIFFESLVNTSFETLVCGVLTGMGSDACKGIQLVKKYKKVKVVAQDEETCVVYGMPRAVYQAGIVDEVVPLENVADMMMKKIGV